MTLQRKRLRLGLPNDVELLTAVLPSEWQDFNVPPSPAVAGANLPLPDVIKGGWSSEWRRGPFFRPFLSLCQGARRHTRASTLSRRSLSGATPDAGTLGGYAGKLSRWIKRLFLSPFGLALEDTPLIWEGNWLCPHRGPWEAKLWGGQINSPAVALLCDGEPHKCSVLVLQNRLDLNRWKLMR